MGYYRDETSFTDEIIAFLFSYRSNFIRKKILFERVNKKRKISYKTYNLYLYRLKKRGILEDKNDTFVLSQKGRMFFQNPYRKVKEKPLNNNKILMIFDIPEPKKKVREWIRRQIKEWDFKMVQKSVWLGNGPLPKEFMDRLKSLGVEKGVKIYNLRRK